MRVTRLSHLCLMLAAIPLSTSVAAAKNQVLVVGALHGLHDREQAFDYSGLRAAVVAFVPDILVLEVRPDELAGRKATPGRPEYPKTIWPLLDTMKVKAVAMEPGGEVFREITGDARSALQRMRQRNPDGDAALARLQEAADSVLLSYWERPDQVQNESTATLMSGVQAAQFALAGSAFAAAEARWDGYMLARILQTMRANPGKRIMVIASYKNRAFLERAVQKAEPRRSISAARWFEMRDGDDRVGRTPHGDK